jgi:DNA-binding XRE family transcriptional regulator
MAKIKWDPSPGPVGWNKVKSLRRSKGLTQTQLAAGAGICLTTLYNIEMGYEDRLTPRVKQQLAEFFDCDLDDIFPAEMVGDEPRAAFLERAKKQLAEK